MRKKLKMRQGSKSTKKFAGGGSVADEAEAAATGGSVPANMAAPRSRPRRSVAGRVLDFIAPGNGFASDAIAQSVVRPRVAPATADADAGPPLPLPPPEPPAPSARSRARARPASRRREMTADELNDREMTRILNERSLAAARSGRNMYAAGGRVSSQGLRSGQARKNIENEVDAATSNENISRGGSALKTMDAGPTSMGTRLRANTREPENYKKGGMVKGKRGC